MVMDGFRNPQYTGQPLGNIMFPGGYIQGMPQMAQMGVPHQMMPGPGDGRTVPQMALMPQAPPQRKDAKPKVMCTHPGCGASFFTEKTLREHMKVHARRQRSARQTYERPWSARSRASSRERPWSAGSRTSAGRISRATRPYEQRAVTPSKKRVKTQSTLKKPRYALQIE